MKKKFSHFKEHFFDRGVENHLSPYEMFWIFLVASVLGYCIEMVFGRITNGFWESRQSLVYGPFGLAYGLGAIVLSLLLYKDKEKHWALVFLKSYFWLSVAEYIMSLGEELCFGVVAWDYSDMPLNIGGRVCALYSLFWGFLGLAWAKWMLPFVKNRIAKVSLKPGKIAFYILVIFLVYDIGASIVAAKRYDERQLGEAPSNAIEVLLDKQFPDHYMEYVYSNAAKVDDQGNVSEVTISGRQVKDPIT